MQTKVDIHTAIDMIEDKRTNLKKIISIGCQMDAFQLLALHLDFLGKILHRLNTNVTVEWENDKPDAKTCFNLVCTQINSMKKYNSDILRDNLRNGMIHNEIPKKGLTLTHNIPQNLSNTNAVINLNDLYSDFCSACDDVIQKLNDYEKQFPSSLTTNKKFPKTTVTVELHK